MKSAKVLKLASLSCLLMLTIWKLACFMITSTLLLFIRMITCFHNGSLVVIFNLGLAMFDLWMILLISLIFLGDRVGNKSLI